METALITIYEILKLLNSLRLSIKSIVYLKAEVAKNNPATLPYMNTL